MATGPHSRAERSGPAVGVAAARQGAFDPEVIGHLRDAGRRQGKNLLARLSAIFSDQMLPRLPQLRSAAAVGDAATVAEVAHLLKGSCRMLGAVRLGNLLEEMEARGLNDDLRDCEGDLAALEEEFERAGNELRAIVAADL